MEGIDMQDTIEALSQFADDTNIFSLFKSKSLPAVLDTLLEFEYNTGLKTNHEKSTIFRLGKIRNTNVKLKTS